jgi:dTDP-4-dehydrorhamnose reductase
MEAARRVGAYVVYLSTDYVFDGTKESPYVEWDAPRPACGRYGGNMVKTVLRLAGGDGALSFVDDQRGHPTFADDLARMLRTIAVSRLPGIFHVTNQGAVTWYEFVRAVLEAAGHDPDRVQPITTADLQPPRPAPRPANSVLDNAALRLQGIDLLPDFHEPLARLVRELTS